MKCMLDIFELPLGFSVIPDIPSIVHSLTANIRYKDKLCVAIKANFIANPLGKNRATRPDESTRYFVSGARKDNGRLLKKQVCKIHSGRRSCELLDCSTIKSPSYHVRVQSLSDYGSCYSDTVVEILNRTGKSIGYHLLLVASGNAVNSLCKQSCARIKYSMTLGVCVRTGFVQRIRRAHCDCI